MAAGAIELRNTGNAGVVIEDVRLVGRDSGLAVRGVFLRPQFHQVETVTVLKEWPPFPASDRNQKIVRPSGAVLPSFDHAKRGYLATEVLIHVIATRRGRFSFRGIDVDYRVKGTRYTERFVSPFVACAGIRSRCTPIESF